ncbi:histone H1.10-like [Leptodactylus fuscus]|uniref:histone H1.10-like n=1 Tax=Leptodactylus fuscus TaxID=238119 RepID=UPI003F4E64F2
MVAELEETVPSSEEDEEAERSSRSRGKGATKRGKKKKNQPGRYSQLVVDTIRKLGERNGSSLAKIYGEAKKVPWFDQQNGRTYLKYSVKALVQNDTLLQVKGQGANGSFRLNKKKLEVPPEKKPSPAPKPPARRSASPGSKKSPKKAKPKKEPPKKSSKKGGGKKVKKKPAKPSLPKVHKSKKAS